MKFARFTRNFARASVAAVAVALFSTAANAGSGIPDSKTVSNTAQVAPSSVEPAFTVYSGAAHIANGTGLRNSPSGTIRLRGAPSDAVVKQAWLYWDFTSLASPTTLQSKIYFGKRAPYSPYSNTYTLVTGTQIGSGSDACWLGGSNFAYRANVTSLILPATGINADYIVTLQKGASSSVNGANPWGPSTPNIGPLAEGASLVVIYSSKLENTIGHVTIYDVGLAGFEFQTTPFSYSLLSLPGPTAGVEGIFTEIGGDGQVGAGVFASSSTSGETVSLNGTIIAGPGSPYIEDSDWNGTDGVSLNQLWDTHTHGVTGVLDSPTNSVVITAPGDCLIAIANIITN